MRWLLLAAAPCLVGCGPAVIGEWESNERTQGEANLLTVEAQFVASAKLWILRTVGGEATAQSFDFDVTWDERRDGQAYSFDLVCTESPYGDCDPEDNFGMNCDLEGDDQNLLTCAADQDTRWESYEGLAWHKLE